MKIGVAIIACDRLEFTLECAYSIFKNKGPVEELIIFNDGNDMAKSMTYDIEWIDNKPPYQSVGVTKNKALKYLLSKGCTDIFLVENDQVILTPNVWMNYIDAAKMSGIQHLNFGYHGPANRTPDYQKANPRYIVEYPGGTKIALNPNSVGAFSYFTKDFVTKVGFHDEYFKNAWEHVELCQRAIEKGLLPAFWWFPDVAGSENWITECKDSIAKSSITHTPEWTRNMQKGAEYYKKLHGWIPTQSPDAPLEEVLKRLKSIYNAGHKS